MAKLTWDDDGSRYYELGVSDVAAFINGTGYAWNGVSNVSESPSGADVTTVYADNIKYGSIRGAEKLEGSISAYQTFKEFCVCDGRVEAAPGVFVKQQTRQSFGLVYKTKIGNDTKSLKAGYKLHIIWNATVSPSSKSHSTINDSPEAVELSYDFTTDPVAITGHKPIASMTIDSRTVNATKLAALEAKIYGGASSEPTLPTPDEVVKLVA